MIIDVFKIKPENISSCVKKEPDMKDTETTLISLYLFYTLQW